MQTVFVIEMKGVVPSCSKEAIRKKYMQDLQEGLIVIDDTMRVTSHTIQGEVGIEFNKE